jgi:serine/threonine protein kinase
MTATSDDGFPKQYVPVRKIASGGFGTVWEAREPNDDTTIVIKIPSGYLDPEDRARFGREVRLQSLLEHPNILPILDYSLDVDSPWFAAPKAECNLADALPALGESEALSLFGDVLTGVAFAHRNRVLHRDLKPENILIFKVDGRRHAVVADFGLGRQFTRDTSFKTASRLGAGTPGWAPPEQWTDFRNVDHRADIYSLGKILEYVLNAVAIPGAPLRHRLEYCIRTATAARPENRYRLTDELAADFRLVIDNPTSLQRPIDTALGMVQTLIENEPLDISGTRELAQFFLENRDDSQLITTMFPRLPYTVLKALLIFHAAATLPVVEAYVAVLREPLAIDYLMTSLRLLEDVLSISEEGATREACLIAMIDVASRYSLVEANYVAIRCIVSERDETVMQALASHVRQDAAVAGWCSAALQHLSLPPVLRRAINGD